MRVKALILLHTLLQGGLQVFLRDALINELVGVVLFGGIVLTLLELFVEGEYAALFIKAVLHLEEYSADIKENEKLLIKTCVLAAFIVELVAVVAYVRHQFGLCTDIHRP